MQRERGKETFRRQRHHQSDRSWAVCVHLVVGHGFSQTKDSFLWRFLHVGKSDEGTMERTRGFSRSSKNDRVAMAMA